jgi:Family of unknown function (DUF5723)
MKRLLIITCAVIAILIGTSVPSSIMAQSNMTLYNMKTIPQRIYTNPARMSDAKNFLGMPVISSNSLGFSNSGFTINKVLDLLVLNAEDSFTIDVNRLDNLFKKSNYISVEQHTDILSFGFHVKKKNYIYFSSSINNKFRLTYPRDFISFITQGNGGKNINREFNFAFGIDFLQYIDVGIGYSRKLLDDKLTIGGRYRYIKGINVISTERNKILLRTDPDTYDLTVASDIKINAASSLFPVDDLDLVSQFNDAPINYNNLLKGDNTGWAIDLGADYKFSDKITLSAAINNIGKINWNTNTFNIVSENPGASYSYTGIDVENIFDADGFNIIESFQNIGDTLEEKFNLTETATTFSTGLFAEFYLGGNYNISKDHNAGILFYGNKYQDRFNPAVTLSWNSKLTNIFAFSGSYTITRDNYLNLGLGFSLNGGPFQIYLVSDNIGSLLTPNNVNSFNVRTGFNLTMQRKDLEAKAAKKAAKESKKAAAADAKTQQREQKKARKKAEKIEKKSKVD